MATSTFYDKLSPATLYELARARGIPTDTEDEIISLLQLDDAYKIMRLIEQQTAKTAQSDDYHMSKLTSQMKQLKVDAPSQVQVKTQPQVELPRYSGSKGLAFDNYLKTIDIHFGSDDSEYLYAQIRPLILTSLSGNAKDWFLRNDFDNLVDFIARFQLHFRPESIKLKNYLKLMKFKYNPNRSPIEKYFRLFRKLALQTDCGEDEKLRLFLASITKDTETFNAIVKKKLKFCELDDIL